MKSAKKRNIKKLLLSVLAVVCSMLLLYAVFCMVSTPLFYPQFSQSAEKLHSIPNLWGGFIPQGVTKTEDRDDYLVCGYMSGDNPSRVYRIDADGSETEILLAKEDGSAYTGHAGGLTASGKFVYISNASKIFVLSDEAVRTAKNGDTIAFIGRFAVPCRSSFCASDGKMLYVGEYHADGYETDDSHSIQTTDGQVYQAVVFAYPLDENAEFGVNASLEPTMAFAVRDTAQGFAMSSNGEAYLSCSWGLHDAELYRYTTDGEPDGVFRLEDKTIPLYVLDSNRQTGKLTMPHMSEDMDYRDGRLLIAFEAGAFKYGGGLLPFSVRSFVTVDPDTF